MYLLELHKYNTCVRVYVKLKKNPAEDHVVWNFRNTCIRSKLRLFENSHNLRIHANINFKLRIS